MAIRRCIVTIGLAALLAAGLGGRGIGWAQERSAERFSSQYRRVPPFFGQVGLTPDQRERIYSIRGEYDRKISELTRQLQELKAREMEDCEGVLSPAQKQLLVQLRAARGYRSPATAPVATPALDSVEVGSEPPNGAGEAAKPAEEPADAEAKAADAKENG